MIRKFLISAWEIINPKEKPTKAEIEANKYFTYMGTSFDGNFLDMRRKWVKSGQKLTLFGFLVENCKIHTFKESTEN